MNKNNILKYIFCLFQFYFFDQFRMLYSGIIEVKEEDFNKKVYLVMIIYVIYCRKDKGNQIEKQIEQLGVFR